MTNNKYLPILIKIDRLASWILLIVFLLYFISGYGLTKGLIDTNLAREIHLQWLATIGMVAFLLHSGWAVHLALKRKKLWNKISRWLLISLWSLIFIGFFYLNFFYSSQNVGEQQKSRLHQQDQSF